MKTIKRIISCIILASLIITFMPTAVSADSSVRKHFDIVVNGNNLGGIPVLDVNYDNNFFFSINAIAYYLRDTDKAFNTSISSDEIKINMGEYCEEEPHMWGDGEYLERTKWKLAKTPVYVNGADRKYYSIISDPDENDRRDAFFSSLRLAMLLDASVNVSNGTISINTDIPFSVSGAELDNSGYLLGVNSLLIGDGSTGRTYFEHEADRSVPIASTTKLMSYFVMMDAVSAGEVSLDDYVSISQNVVTLSEGIDGLINFKGIQAAPLSELVVGMLISSSNECALAVAEHVAGSEMAFVDRMNEKACELGLENAYFYNCNGLPVYDEQLLPAKMQNHMSARDMFILASALVNQYPQVLDITSTIKIDLPTLHYESKNTNALAYNVEGVRGLKTGTTNKSGACLVVCLPQEKDGEIHNLISVLFGAEGDFDRGTLSELAIRIARDELKGETAVTEEKYTINPDNPEQDVKRMLTRLK